MLAKRIIPCLDIKDGKVVKGVNFVGLKDVGDPVELAKEWRMDKAMRRLEAILIVASKENLLLISGTGDVIEPDDNVLSTGSGSPYAQAAAKAMMKHSPNMTAEEIVREGLTIASEIDIYTNNNFTIEVLE